MTEQIEWTPTKWQPEVTKVITIDTSKGPRRIKGTTELVLHLEGGTVMPDIIRLNGFDYVREASK